MMLSTFFYFYLFKFEGIINNKNFFPLYELLVKKSGYGVYGPY